MSLINTKLENDILYILPQGRIDSVNAQQVEDEINQACANNPHSHIIIDAADLEYISSAGLRIILRLRKNDSEMKIINVSNDVYEIFDMTGFSEIIPTEKAYRTLSVEGCEVIGQGANGKVYRLDSDTIIKVYVNPDSLPDIQKERELARRAFVLGIPTAIPYDVVKVGNSYGSVFELLNANSFAELISKEPEKLDYYINLYVELVKKIHSTDVTNENMPDMKAVAVDWATFLKDYLPQETGDKLISLVQAVPEVNNMMHGDYHIKNVMMQNGEVLLIDMDTLCKGHPIFELASVYNAYIGFHVIDKDTSKFLGIPFEIAKTIWAKFLPLYLDADNQDTIQSVEDKAKLIGYTRLMRRLIRRNGSDGGHGEKELEFYKNEIIRLTDKLDNLDF